MSKQVEFLKSLIAVVEGADGRPAHGEEIAILRAICTGAISSAPTPDLLTVARALVAIGEALETENRDLLRRGWSGGDS